MLYNFGSVVFEHLTGMPKLPLLALPFLSNSQQSLSELPVSVQIKQMPKKKKKKAMRAADMLDTCQVRPPTARSQVEIERNQLTQYASERCRSSS